MRRLVAAFLLGSVTALRATPRDSSSIGGGIPFRNPLAGETCQATAGLEFRCAARQEVRPHTRLALAGGRGRPDRALVCALHKRRPGAGIHLQTQAEATSGRETRDGAATGSVVAGAPTALFIKSHEPPQVHDCSSAPEIGAVPGMLGERNVLYSIPSKPPSGFSQ